MLGSVPQAVEPHDVARAGVCPGQNESAGKKRNSKTRPGNRHLKGALGASALSIAPMRNTDFLPVKYHRWPAPSASRRRSWPPSGPLITIIWTLLSTGAFYDEPGPNWYTRQHPERATRRAIRTLDDLGYDVTITPRGAT